MILPMFMELATQDTTKSFFDQINKNKRPTFVASEKKVKSKMLLIKKFV